MATVYRTHAITGAKPEAIVLHCSDPRYQAHFHEFLSEHLGIQSYGLIATPGGAQLLRTVDLLPKFSWAGWRWTKFVMNIAGPARFILIGHDDCRWYSAGPFWHRGGNIRELVVDDMRKVRQEITERFPGVNVELYFARLDGQNAEFESV